MMNPQSALVEDTAVMGSYCQRGKSLCDFLVQFLGWGLCTVVSDVKSVKNSGFLWTQTFCKFGKPPKMEIFVQTLKHMLLINLAYV